MWIYVCWDPLAEAVALPIELTVLPAITEVPEVLTLPDAVETEVDPVWK